MILFVPAHDAQTYSNLAIAKTITAEADICLFENAAIKADLLQILASDFANSTARQPLLAMSHGENGSFDDNEKTLLFIETTEIRLLNDRKCFVYACLTANEVGNFVLENLSKTSVYCAYTGKIVPPPIMENVRINDEILSVFVPIFSFIKNNFAECCNEPKAQFFLNELKAVCEISADDLDKIGGFDNEIYTCLYQIWSRLCIFIGGQATDIRHTEAETGYIF